MPGHESGSPIQLYQMEPCFDDEEARAVAECVRSTWVIEGQRTAAFERSVAEYTGAAYAIAVPSCTVALALSLMASGVGPGDEVLVPDLTFVATANAVSLAGARPVLVDICPDSLGLDPDACLRALTPRTRALIPVWFNGRDPRIEALKDIAGTHHLAIVEDAAAALGSRSGGRHAGTFGDLGCISFNTTKIITTGGGGMVLTDEPELAEAVRRLKNHGRLDRRDYHPVVGFNFSFNDVLAALGLAQMRKLEARVAWKHDLCRWYAEKLKDVEGVELLPQDEGCCLWYPEIFAENAEDVKRSLLARGIQTRLFYPPVHTQPSYQATGHFPVAERVSPRGLWLPAAAYLQETDVDRVCAAIADGLRGRG